jgi:hypothetical protein
MITSVLEKSASFTFTLFAMKMEAPSSSKLLIAVYMTMGHHISEGGSHDTVSVANVIWRWMKWENAYKWSESTGVEGASLDLFQTSS